MLTKPGTSKETAAATAGNDDIIFRTLLAHETKTRREKIPGKVGIVKHMLCVFTSFSLFICIYERTHIK